VVAHDVLIHAVSQQWQIARPIVGARLVERFGESAPRRRSTVGSPVPPPPEWMRRRIVPGRGYDPLAGSVVAEFRRRAP
jgi:hypothetical protein